MLHAALDTSLGFALALEEDEKLLLNANLPCVGRESDRLLLPWILEQLANTGKTPAEIERWTVGVGPGSFAGLRCGIAMVKGFAAASGAVIDGAPSSVALAAQAAQAGDRAVTVLHDGRCGQLIPVRVERAADDAPWQLVGTPEPVFPDAVKDDCDRWVTAQLSSLPALPPFVSARLVSLNAVDAAGLLCAATSNDTEPLYIRQAVFVKPATLRLEVEK